MDPLLFSIKKLFLPVSPKRFPDKIYRTLIADPINNFVKKIAPQFFVRRFPVHWNVKAIR